MPASRMWAAKIRVHAFWMRVAHVLSECLGEDLGRTGEHSNPQPIPHRSMRVSGAMLLRSGHCRPSAKLRGNRLQLQYASGEPGNLATTIVPGVCGKVVHVDEIFRELNWAEISAAIDTYPFFSLGLDATTSLSNAGVLPDCAWHAARIHHRCRSFGSAEACCERVGSMMKLQWQKNTKRNLQRFMEATLVRCAGVMGGSGCAFDEQLCKDICGAMEDLGRQNPVTKGAGDVSRPIQARRDAYDQHLVELGRAAKTDGKFASSDSESEHDCELASNSSDGLAPEQDSKRSRIAHDVARSFAGGVTDIAFVVTRANSKMRPPMVLPVKAEKVLRQDMSLAPFHSGFLPSSTDKQRTKVGMASSSGTAGSTGAASSSTTREPLPTKKTRSSGHRKK